MKSTIVVLVILVSLTSVGHAQITRLGRAGPLLRDADIASISRLSATTGRKLWLVEAHRGQVLPETWTVYAYLTPETTGPTIGRGTFITLESVVTSEIAQLWRVTSRNGQWAQVALAESKTGNGLHDESRDRPFPVRGRFSDAELVSLVEFIRSSPRRPPIPESPDGTIHLEFPDEVSGHLPISSIVREPRQVVVTLQKSHASWDSVTVEFLNGRWQIKQISFLIALRLPNPQSLIPNPS